MRIAGIDPDQVTGEVARVFQEQTQRYGRPLASASVMARRPELYLAYQQFSQRVAAATLLPAHLLALVNRRVAAHNQCPF